MTIINRPLKGRECECAYTEGVRCEPLTRGETVTKDDCRACGSISKALEVNKQNELLEAQIKELDSICYAIGLISATVSGQYEI